MATLMTVLGIVVFAVGLLISIAWHEIGHLTWAKIFRIRVPQYMVGFGPTVFSRRRGETEYGLKAIPFGGYIRMVGMFPPGPDGKVTARATSPWRSMIEDARAASFEELQPGDESRTFYSRKPWQRVIVMFAGPFHNLILAVVVFGVVMMGFGINTTTTTVSSVASCVVPSVSGSQHEGCPKGAPETPAKKAGLRPGDTIVSFAGHHIDDWDQLQKVIRGTTGPTTMVVERADHRVTLHPDLIANTVQVIDSDGNYVAGKTTKAGFLGFSPADAIRRQSPGQVVDKIGGMFGSAAHAVVDLPNRVPNLWGSVFDGEKRSPDSPVGVVGVARVGGQVFTLHVPASQRIATMLMLLAGFNLSLGLLNLLPLLPLDGGHILGALWEGIRRHASRLLRRADPGSFDVAKMMPVAYVVAGVLVCFSLLVLVADVVNPLRIS